MKEHKIALIVLALLLLEHFAGMFELRFNYNLGSDDLSYVNAGILFAKTGTISCHDNVPSAQIMPGMPVLLGIFTLIFGEGKLYWIALKLAWGLMGVLTAWYCYRIVSAFAPKWAGVLAMIPFFRPDIVWMNNLPLTETPFMLALTVMVYCTLMMGKDGSCRYFWGCAIAYMCALLLKANIAPYPLLALVYLLIVRYDRKKLLRQVGILTCMVLLFVIPWTIRNYIQFHAFVPLTYGSGNPLLLGTYQGIGYPDDSDLDYVKNVDEVVREQYAQYYSDDGTLPVEYRRFVKLQRDKLKANYRISEWMKREFSDFVYSYAVLKPQKIINSIFYWKPVFNIGSEKIELVHWLDISLCIVAIALSLALKRLRRPVLYLTAVYLANVLIYATTFAFSRYNASLMSLRFALVGFSVYLILYAAYAAVRQFRQSEQATPGETA